MGRPRAASWLDVDGAKLWLEVVGVCFLFKLSGVRASLPSPSLTSASIVFSKFPPTPLRTMAFLCSSLKPISRSFCSLISVSSASLLSNRTDAPKPPLVRGDAGLRGPGEADLPVSCFFFEPSGKMEEADLKPNRLPVFGGSGGGVSSDEVLPVLCFLAPARDRCIYFERMNLSIAGSTSSASTGMGGFLLSGL